MRKIFAILLCSVLIMPRVAVANDVDALDAVGWPPLMYAATNGDVAEVKRLIGFGANVNFISKSGRSVLTQSDNREVCQILVDNGAKVDLQNNDGKTALILNADVDSEDMVEVIKCLLDNGADINMRDNDGWTALMRAAKDADCTENLRVLLARGANVNVQNKNGETALMCAAEEEGDGVKILLAAGANVNVQDNDGWTALIHAAVYNQMDNIQVLLEYGADPDIKDGDGDTVEDVLSDENVPAFRIMKTKMKLAKMEGGFKQSHWKNEDGKLNTARLASDSIAGVVLGTAGGLVTSSIMKKNQASKGFEKLQCSIGGQYVAGWGDEFMVGRQY